MIAVSVRKIVSAGAVVLSVAFILPWFVAAQDDHRQNPTVIRNQKMNYIEDVMGLAAGDKSDFWRIYKEYDAGLSKIRERRMALAAVFLATHEGLSDAEALDMLNQKLRIDSEELEFKQAFVSRFRQVLSGRKVLRLYQTENRFDTAAISELYRNIPVIR